MVLKALATLLTSGPPSSGTSRSRSPPATASAAEARVDSERVTRAVPSVTRRRLSAATIDTARRPRRVAEAKGRVSGATGAANASSRAGSRIVRNRLIQGSSCQSKRPDRIRSAPMLDDLTAKPVSDSNTVRTDPGAPTHSVPSAKRLPNRSPASMEPMRSPLRACTSSRTVTAGPLASPGPRGGFVASSPIRSFPERSRMDRRGKSYS